MTVISPKFIYLMISGSICNIGMLILRGKIRVSLRQIGRLRAAVKRFTDLHLVQWRHWKQGKSVEQPKPKNWRGGKGHPDVKVLTEGKGMEVFEKMEQATMMVMVLCWEEKAVGERMEWQEKVHRLGDTGVEKREKEQAQENIGNMVLRLVHRYVALKCGVTN